MNYPKNVRGSITVERVDGRIRVTVIRETPTRKLTSVGDIEPMQSFTDILWWTIATHVRSVDNFVLRNLIHGEQFDFIARNTA